MADMYAVSGETLTGIADAIRSKTGSDDFMTVASMASAIEGISGGGMSLPWATKTAVTYFEFDRYQGVLNSSGYYIEHNLGDIPTGILMIDADWNDNMPYDDNGGARNVSCFAIYIQCKNGEYANVHGGVRSVNPPTFSAPSYASGLNSPAAYDCIRNITEAGFMWHPYATVAGFQPNHRYYVITWR